MNRDEAARERALDRIQQVCRRRIRQRDLADQRDPERLARTVQKVWGGGVDVLNRLKVLNFHCLMLLQKPQPRA